MLPVPDANDALSVTLNGIEHQIKALGKKVRRLIPPIPPDFELIFFLDVVVQVRATRWRRSGSVPGGGFTRRSN